MPLTLLPVLLWRRSPFLGQAVTLAELAQAATVQIVRVELNIHKQRRSTGQAERLSRGEEGVRRCNDCVTRPNVERTQGEMERVSS